MTKRNRGTGCIITAGEGARHADGEADGDGEDGEQN
jgi:hypothetical protein